MPNRKIIVYAGTSADGFIARPDGDIDWLTSRPALEGFYGIGTFSASIDTKILGRKTFEKSLALGAKFDTKTKYYVFSSRPAAAVPPHGVEFVSEPIAPFAQRLRAGEGKHIWMMGGGGIIASFLDAGAIDEFIINVVPVLIGDGITLIAPRCASDSIRAFRLPDALTRVVPSPDAAAALQMHSAEPPIDAARGNSVLPAG